MEKQEFEQLEKELENINIENFNEDFKIFEKELKEIDFDI